MLTVLSVVVNLHCSIFKRLDDLSSYPWLSVGLVEKVEKVSLLEVGSIIEMVCQCESVL